MVEVKNGIPKIISSPSETNLDFKLFDMKSNNSLEDLEITLDDGNKISWNNFLNNDRYALYAQNFSSTSMTYKPFKIAFGRKIKETDSGEFDYFEIVNNKPVPKPMTRELRRKATYRFATTLKTEVVNSKYNFNTTNIKHLLFNEAPTYHDITEVVGSVEENKFKLIFNKTVAFFDGWWGYDDWIKVLLAQVCVYKLK